VQQLIPLIKDIELMVRKQCRNKELTLTLLLKLVETQNGLGKADLTGF